MRVRRVEAAGAMSRRAMETPSELSPSSARTSTSVTLEPNALEVSPAFWRPEKAKSDADTCAGSLHTSPFTNTEEAVSATQKSWRGLGSYARARGDAAIAAIKRARRNLQDLLAMAAAA